MLVTVQGDSYARAIGFRQTRLRPLTLTASLSVRLAVVTYAIVAATAAVIDFVGFRTARFDLGNAVQAIWSTAHGRVL